MKDEGVLIAIAAMNAIDGRGHQKRSRKCEGFFSA